MGSVMSLCCPLRLISRLGRAGWSALDCVADEQGLLLVTNTIHMLAALESTNTIHMLAALDCAFRADTVLPRTLRPKCIWWNKQQRQTIKL